MKKLIKRNLLWLVLAGSFLFNGCAHLESKPKEKYAVMINGSDEERFVCDMNFIYNVFLLSGIDKNNIFVLDVKKDRGKTYPVNYLTTKKNMELIFSELEKKVNESDDFFLHIEGHGKRDQADNHLLDKNGEFLLSTILDVSPDYPSEFEFEEYWSRIKSKNKFDTVETCYSGGIMKRLTKEGDIGVASSKKNEESYSSLTDKSFAELFYEALIFPGESDKNSDGKVSVAEAFDYAKERHYKTKDGLTTPLLKNRKKAEKFYIMD